MTLISQSDKFLLISHMQNVYVKTVCDVCIFSSQIIKKYFKKVRVIYLWWNHASLEEKINLNWIISKRYTKYNPDYIHKSSKGKKITL